MILKKNSFIKWMIMAFAIFCSLFFVANKVNASSTNLYFKDEPVATGYNKDGSIIFTEALEVCAVNDKAGYQIDQKKLRISEVIINHYNDTYNFDIDNEKFDEYVKVETKTECSNAKSATSSTTDKITINLKKILENLSFKDSISNAIYISFKLEKRNTIFGITTGYGEYDVDVKYFRGSKEMSTSQVSLYKSSSDFLKEKFNFNSVLLSINTYNSNNKKNKDSVKIIFNTNFSLKLLASINLYYTDNTTSDKITIASKSDSGNLFNQFSYEFLDTDAFLEGEHNYNFTKIRLLIYDKYNNMVTVEKTLSKNLKVDTLAPSVVKAGVYNDSSKEQTGLNEVKFAFKLSEKIKSHNLTSITYKIGNKEYTQENVCKTTIYATYVDEFKCGLWLSGEGKITLVSYTLEISDTQDNMGVYTKSTSNISNQELTLSSNISEFKITNNSNNAKNYFYSEQAKIELMLKEDAEYAQIILLDEKGSRSDASFTKENKKIVILLKDTQENAYNYIELYKKIDTISTELEEKLAISVNFNKYLDLDLDQTSQYKTSSERNLIVLDNVDDYSFDSSKVNSSHNQFSCNTNNRQIICAMNNTITTDSETQVTIEKGAIVLTNGMQNNEETFTYILNVSAPIVSVNINDTYKYNNIYYFNSDNAMIEITYSDTYYLNLCIDYKITRNGNNYTQNEKCGNSSYSYKLKQLSIKDNDKYVLSFTIDDGQNKTDNYVYTFVYSNFLIDVNRLEVNEGKELDKKFNYFKLDYSSIDKNLLDSITINTNIANYSPVTCNLKNNNCLIEKTNLPNIDDEIEFNVTIKDKLNNIKNLSYLVLIDTIDPSFEKIIIEKTETDTNYEIRITNNGEDILTLKVNDEEKNAINGVYYLDKDVKEYLIELKDSAGNVSKQTYVTVLPNASLESIDVISNPSLYEIRIAPYYELYDIESKMKYLVFEYTTNQIDKSKLDSARTTACTLGKTTNCYAYYNLTGFSQTDNTIYTTISFKKGYTYVLEIVVNNEVLTSTSGGLVRLDLKEADVTAPIADYIEDNPDYISSLSSKKFEFKVKVSDENLKDKFKYVLVNNSYNITSVNDFINVYKNCYGAKYGDNSCGIKGEESYSLENNENIAKVILDSSSNKNLKDRLLDGKYAIYLLLEDNYNNQTIFKVREFENITTPSVIKYSEDGNSYSIINNKQEVITTNSAKIMISKSNRIEIEKVIINDEEKSCNVDGCSYDLSIGKYVIKVINALGNEISVTIYSGYTGRPNVEVYYNYNSTYFKLVDTTLTYSANNVDNVYIKIKNEDITTIKVKMEYEHTYDSGTIFNSLLDDSNQYGLSLADLMELSSVNNYQGEIRITVSNTNNKETSIILTIDNSNPDITIMPPDTNIDLFGTSNKLSYESSEYKLTYNYNKNVTYRYLMNQLSLKVDGITFDEISLIDRFNFNVNGEVVKDYDTSIDLGDNKIIINYFDTAGNEASPLTLNIKVIDNEAPKIMGLESTIYVEVNEIINLSAKLILEDNYDAQADCEVKILLGGTSININNYIFTTVGTYTLNYEISDTSKNKATFTQYVIVKDTIPPVVENDITKKYVLGIKEQIKIDLPKFSDNSTTSDIYPDKIILKDKNNNLIDSVSLSYPIKRDNNSLFIQFNEEYELGIYKLVLCAYDESFNETEVIIELELVDKKGPVIEVKLNGIVQNDGASVTLPLNNEVKLEVSAYDDIDGKINNISRTIIYNSNPVNNIDWNKSGEYVITYKASDSENNVSTFTLTIIIDIDNTKPIINNVKINDKVLKSGEINQFNDRDLRFEVDYYDASIVTITIQLFGEIYNNLENGSYLSFDKNLTQKGELKVIVSDLSNNQTIVTYQIAIDNEKPLINGIDNAYIYNSSVKVDISDINLKELKIYKDNQLIKEANTNSELELNEAGIYKIIALDTFGNEEVKLFAINSDNKYMIVTDDGDNAYDYDTSKLIEVKLVDTNLVLVLDDDEKIKNNDEIYILVNYPDSNKKYIIYSMDGRTYIESTTITLDSVQVNGVVNEGLLTKIGDKYYAYMMILENENSGINVDSGNTSSSNQALKGIISFILVIIGAVSVVVLFIKIRRRVRAI